MTRDHAFLNLVRVIQNAHKPPAKPLSVFQDFDKEAAGQNVVFFPAFNPDKAGTAYQQRVIADRLREVEATSDAVDEHVRQMNTRGWPDSKSLQDTRDELTRETQQDHDDEIDGSYR